MKAGYFHFPIIGPRTTKYARKRFRFTQVDDRYWFSAWGHTIYVFLNRGQG